VLSQLQLYAGQTRILRSMDANNIAAFVASVLGSIGLLIAGLRYIIKLENLPLISRLDKLESTLEIALRERVTNGTKKTRR
jgi:hypothetical protein